MASTSLAVGTQAAAGLRDAAYRRERWFFGGISLAMAVTIFIGFAPSYYLRSQIGPPHELSALLHLHGFLCSMWVVLFVVQTSLVAAGNVRLHRNLGMGGVVLATAMMIMGAIVAVVGVRQGILGASHGTPITGPQALMQLVLPFGAVIVFPTLFVLAIYFRRRTDIHKRLMVISNLELVGAALGRIPLLTAISPLAFFAAADLFIVALAVYDRSSRGRVHPATLWAGVFTLSMQVGRVLVAPTAAWQDFATWMLGL
jgi:hypothetical protein